MHPNPSLISDKLVLHRFLWAPGHFQQFLVQIFSIHRKHLSFPGFSLNISNYTRILLPLPKKVPSINDNRTILIKKGSIRLYKWSEIMSQPVAVSSFRFEIENRFNTSLTILRAHAVDIMKLSRVFLSVHKILDSSTQIQRCSISEQELPQNYSTRKLPLRYPIPIMSICLNKLRLAIFLMFPSSSYLSDVCNSSKIPRRISITRSYYCPQ